MRKHARRPKSAALSQVYELFLEQAEMDPRIRIREVGEPPNKCSVLFYRNNELPFSLIVNTGERVDYHLFYVRYPKSGQKRALIREFGSAVVNENPKGELTIEIRTPQEARRMWKHAESFV